MKNALRKGLRFLRELSRISIIATCYYNLLSPHVTRIHGGKIIIYRYTKLHFERKAKLILENGTLRVGWGKPFGARNASLFRMERNSVIHTYGDNIIEYGADVLLKPNAEFVMKKGSYINCHCLIRCSHSISIGEGTITATELHLRDSDGHRVNGVLKETPIIIGDHVWLGARVTILKGVTIADGAVIGACSLVTKDVPEKCLAYGVPAHVAKENVEWTNW